MVASYDYYLLSVRSLGADVRDEDQEAQERMMALTFLLQERIYLRIAGSKKHADEHLHASGCSRLQAVRGR